MHYDQNNPLRILYVGRLVAEKGIDIILSAIEVLSLDAPTFDSIEWEICGEGEYKNTFEKLQLPSIHIHGYVNKNALDIIQKKSHIAVVPSHFLETFGLSALESLSKNIGVIGFKKGGLVPFIHKDLTLNEGDPVESLVAIIKDILSGSTDFSKCLNELDILSFSYESWKKELEVLTKDTQRILLVNDYLTPVGGAEVYVNSLKVELEKLGKDVEIYGYKNSLTPFKRKLLFLSSFFAFWRWWSIRKKIQEFNPDLIWCQSTLRYIGFFGMVAISQSGAEKYLTHHDLGLISPYPSKIYSEEDIPSGSSLRTFLGNSKSVFIRVKYFYLKLYWNLLQGFDLMIVPSEFLEKHIGKYISETKIKIFSHTIFPD